MCTITASIPDGFFLIAIATTLDKRIPLPPNTLSTRLLFFLYHTFKRFLLSYIFFEYHL